MSEGLKHVIKQSFPVTGMTCSACANSVETILIHTEGVQSAKVNLATNTVNLEFEEKTNPSTLKEALKNVGYDLIIEDKKEGTLEELDKKRLKIIKTRTIGSFIFTIPIFIISMFYMSWEAGKWISFVFTLPVVFWFGNHFYINAFKQARHGFANMDTLVALSTGIAFIFSVFNLIFPQILSSKGIEPHVYFESVGVIISFISIGKWLEERAKSGTAASIKKLLKLQVKSLHVQRDGKVLQINISEVQIGDIVLVKPGELIPVDGEILSGTSYIDESMMTGEAIPVFKKKSDAVFAGTINQKGSFSFKALKIGKETYLAKIISMVQEAQASKAPVQRLADKIAGIFVPVVIALSLVTFVGWIIIGGENAFAHAFLNSIAVLVISCPCALGLATPTAIMVGIGKGAENNILIKDAESLEQATKTNIIILDKTGTLTEGKPVVIQDNWYVEKVTHLESILLEMESNSEHPLSTAIINHLNHIDRNDDVLKTFESITGKGLQAMVKDGKQYFIGNRSFVNDVFTRKSKAHNLSKAEQEGTEIYFFDENQILASFIIADKIRSGAKNVIEELEKSNIEAHLLSGDNKNVTTNVAQKLNIKHYSSEMLPDQKAKYIKELQNKGNIVAMVGDGINDAQALAQANISIAMGKGSDIAMDVAKITLIGSDLNILPKAFRLSKLTVKGIHQNLFWAFIYNIIGIPIAAGLLYPINGFLLDPMIAGGAMALSSVSVVSNSLRLKWKKL